jgi:hypothetical protein
MIIQNRHFLTDLAEIWYGMFQIAPDFKKMVILLVGRLVGQFGWSIWLNWVKLPILNRFGIQM